MIFSKVRIMYRNINDINQFVRSINPSHRKTIRDMSCDQGTDSM